VVDLNDRPLHQSANQINPFGERAPADTTAVELATLRRRVAELEAREELLRETVEHLRASETEKALVLNSMPDSVVFLDREMRVRWTNREAVESTGLTPEKLVGRHCYQTWNTRDTPCDGCPVVRAVETGTTQRAEMTAPDGRAWLITGTPVFGAGGVLGAVETARGVTQAERALKHEFSFRSGIIECAAEGLCVCHEIPDFPYVQFTVWNTRMTEITGYTMEEINRLGWYQSLYPDPEYQARARDRMARMRTGENLRNEEWQITRSDGTERPICISTSIVSGGTGEVHVLALIQDLTERRRVEEEHRKLETQVQQAQKLKSLGVLAGGIAHDFNNLLTAILGHANLALLDLPPESPARQDLREIEKVSHLAADLCKQMLAYAGMGRFVVETLNLSHLVQELSHLLQVSISKKAVLRCRLAEDLPVVEADAAQMRQVVMNLVINASEAIGDRDGYVDVATGLLECDEAYLLAGHMPDTPPSGLYVYIDVSDTGAGMDPATQARIFEPFFTTKFTGRGLGLAAVQGIVRGHRGTIRVHSVPGAGTTFRVLFPVSAGATLSSAQKTSEELWRGSGTVLLVDDEEPVRNVAKTIVERCGFTVLAATDGREAVRLFQQHSDDVSCVLLDLAMPHMNGAETFRELRRIRPDVRVVVASGYSEQEILRHFAGQHPAGFIEKPYRVTELSAKLRSVLTGRSDPGRTASI
jgi:PAS domain S-box-containing protein